MATLNDLKKIVLNLPETSEGTHFRLMCYKALGKSFVGIEKDNIHISFRLDKNSIQKLSSESPDVFKEVWQNQRSLIGIRFNVEKVTEDQLQQIVELAWRNIMPKKLIKEFGK